MLQVGSHKSGVECEKHLPQSTDYCLDVAQDMIGFLAYKCMLPSHIQFFIHQNVEVVCRATLNSFITYTILIMGIALTQVKDLTFGLVELPEVDKGPFVRPVISL